MYSRTWDKISLPQPTGMLRWPINQSSSHSRLCMASTKSEAWRQKWLVPIHQEWQGPGYTQVWPLTWLLHQVCLLMTTWSSCLSRPRVTPRVRSSAYTMRSVPTYVSKEPSTVFPPTRHSVVVTTVLWLPDFRWVLTQGQALKLAKSNLPGSWDYAPGSTLRDLN